MYIRRTRLNPHKQGALLKLFVAGAIARAAAELIGVPRNTAAGFYLRLRKLIAGKWLSYRLSGEVEADESYFGGVRKGRRGRGAPGKVVVFGLLKRGGRSTPRLSPPRTRTASCRLSGSTCSRTASCTPMPFGLIMRWPSMIFTICGSTIPAALPTTTSISTALRASGTRRSGTCASSTGSTPRIFTGF